MMFETGSLKNKVIQQTKLSTENGILIPAKIEGECIVTQFDIPYIVRIAPNLERKDKARKKQDDKAVEIGKAPNPFLPYNPNMFVSDLSETHLCLLNRFKLFDYPLLIVTREFEEQQSVLTYDDFFSISLCLQEGEGVAFYNGGLKAGATQPHKHFHFIPYPMDDQLFSIPIDNALRALPKDAELISLKNFPYQHLISRTEWSNNDSVEDIGKRLLSKYQVLMHSIGQKKFDTTVEDYNLIVTRHWMKLALRSAPAYVSISLNALGFAGIFNVRNESQVDQVKELSPLKILQGIGVA
ncbi:MAG: hypothetical protein V3U92_18265 [Cellulophaga sp.]